MVIYSIRETTIPITIEMVIMRNYMHKNTLYRVATDFDARLCKVRYVALPIDDDNVANKRFVQQSMQILKDRQNEIKSKLGLLQNNADFSLNYMQQSMQYFKDQLNQIEKKMTTLQNNVQVKMTHHTE